MKLDRDRKIQIPAFAGEVSREERITRYIEVMYWARSIQKKLAGGWKRVPAPGYDSSAGFFLFREIHQDFGREGECRLSW